MSFLQFEERRSDSPLIERVWRAHSERAGTFHSVASSHCEIVLSRVAGKSWVTLRGPETRVSPADCPADGEWVGIRFSLGTYLRPFPASSLIDRRDVNLAEGVHQSFWLEGSRWAHPDFDNAELLVSELAAEGLLARDSAVAEFLRGEVSSLSQRTSQRRFLRATGMSYRDHQQIGRARQAVQLLREGVSIVETVHLAGYFDQPHLTRALRHHIGITPAQLVRGSDTQLSFLYKTDRRW